MEFPLRRAELSEDAPMSVVVKLNWLWDLLAPTAPGKHFSRYGHRVIVSETDLRAARAQLAAGAKDVVFQARRTDDHYELESPTAIM
jgi:hypothetical protein